MHAWEAIQKTVEHIEDNITEELKVEYLADISHLSSFYYQRLFSRLVKKPVAEYIKLRRLARSTEALLNEETRILDVAVEYGFNDHSIYTKNFKSSYGVTPDEYRKNPVRLNHFNKPELLLNYTMIDKDVPLITESIVIEITRKTLDKTRLFNGFSCEINIENQIPLGESTGIDNAGQLQEKYRKEESKIPNLLPDCISIGASYPSERDGYFNYFVGGEVENKAKDFASFEMTSGEYITCSVEAETFEELVSVSLGKGMNYLMGIWLPKHKIEIEPYSIEMYTGTDQSPPNMEIWVKVK